MAAAVTDTSPSITACWRAAAPRPRTTRACWTVRRPTFSFLAAWVWEVAQICACWLSPRSILATVSAPIPRWLSFRWRGQGLGCANLRRAPCMLVPVVYPRARARWTLRRLTWNCLAALDAAAAIHVRSLEIQADHG